MQLRSVASRASSEPLALSVIEAFAVDWYRKLDRHVAVGELLPVLADADLEFVLPETQFRGAAAFRSWYEGVIALFFDEVHEVTSVAVAPGSGGVVADVVVNWQARRWRPPAPRSQWIGFDAFQRWEMVAAPAGDRPIIRRYVVNELRPMPGSPAL